jgi:hypothetical protein
MISSSCFGQKPDTKGLELNARDSRLPALGGVIAYNDGPLNEAPPLAARGAVLVDAVAEGFARGHLCAQAGPSARITPDPARRELAVEIEYRHFTTSQMHGHHEDMVSDWFKFNPGAGGGSC